MDSSAYAALAGAVIGSVLTFSLGFIATKRQEVRKAKMNVLVVLMGGRMRIASQEISDFVNTIPIIFAKDEKVRRSYQYFCASLGRPEGMETVRRYNEMVIEIGKSLGFSGSITEADLSMGFMLLPQQPAAPITPSNASNASVQPPS